MIRVDKSFACAACDICKKPKDATLMCTFIADQHDDAKFEEVCWCVCEECQGVLEKVHSYYQDLIATE